MNVLYMYMFLLFLVIILSIVFTNIIIHKNTHVYAFNNEYKVKIIQFDTRHVNKESINNIVNNTRDISGLFDEFFDENNIQPCHNFTSKARQYSNGDINKLDNIDKVTLVYVMMKHVAKYIGYEYEYRVIENIEDRHPSWAKLYNIMQEVYKPTSNWDVLVVMDTDAWIRDPILFEKTVSEFHKSEKQLAVAREAYCSESYNERVKQVFNGGFYMIKKTHIIYEFLKNVWDLPVKNIDFNLYKSEWSWEQICLNYVYNENKDYYDTIFHFLPLIDFNTPLGQIVAHCWLKDKINEMIIPDMLKLVFLYSLRD